MTKYREKFMYEAIKLAEKSIDNGGGPFGAVIVHENKIVAKAYNQVVLKNDPTAHAEVEAIRAACETLKTHKLDHCAIYSSSEPCPMCLGAVYWAHIDQLFYGSSRQAVNHIGFDDQRIYNEFDLAGAKRKIKASQHLESEAKKVLVKWKEKADKTPY
jgi:tRNA(Arg) A34 adenosine deaminase TadA